MGHSQKPARLSSKLLKWKKQELILKVKSHLGCDIEKITKKELLVVSLVVKKIVLGQKEAHLGTDPNNHKNVYFIIYSNIFKFLKLI